jgi:tubulin-specific chaperone A
VRKTDSYFPEKFLKISTTETTKMRTTTTSTDANKDEEEHQMHEKRVSQVLRELKIKTGVLRRLSKEREMYEREVLDFTSRIEKDERIDRNDDDETNDNNNNNNNNARQRKQCLEESKAMVRDTFVRLEKAFVDLEEFVETLVEGKEDFDVRDEVTGKEEFRLAKEQVERVKPSLC